MARSSSSGDVPDAKRLQVMQAVGRHTKTSTVQMLSHLQSTGALAGNDTERRLRRDIQLATEAHGSAITPYGPVIQQLRLGAPGLDLWEICHPFAFLYDMTQNSPAFREVMRKCTSDGRHLRLVTYMDGLVPGNPFRPEKSHDDFFPTPQKSSRRIFLRFRFRFSGFLFTCSKRRQSRQQACTCHMHGRWAR